MRCLSKSAYAYKHFWAGGKGIVGGLRSWSLAKGRRRTERGSGGNPDWPMCEGTVHCSPRRRTTCPVSYAPARRARWRSDLGPRTSHRARLRPAVNERVPSVVKWDSSFGASVDRGRSVAVCGGDIALGRARRMPAQRACRKGIRRTAAEAHLE